VVAILFRGLSVRLLRREIGLRWIAYGIVLPLWVLATAVFEESVQRLHQHGRLLGALGFVDGQSVNRWGTLLYFVRVAAGSLSGDETTCRGEAHEEGGASG
jgi:hypothetical protein